MESVETPTRVLIVEDNPVDVRMIRFALQDEHAWRTEPVVTDNGEKAIDFLLQKGAFVDAPRPDLVILDLNLPKRNGTEVLQVIRNTSGLTKLAVIVLSSSPSDLIRNRVNEANLEANCYFTKPLDVGEFIALGKALRRCYERSRENESLSQ